MSCAPYNLWKKQVVYDYQQSLSSPSSHLTHHHHHQQPNHQRYFNTCRIWTPPAHIWAWIVSVFAVEEQAHQRKSLLKKRSRRKRRKDWRNFLDEELAEIPPYGTWTSIHLCIIYFSFVKRHVCWYRHQDKGYFQTPHICTWLKRWIWEKGDLDSYWYTLAWKNDNGWSIM